MQRFSIVPLLFLFTISFDHCKSPQSVDTSAPNVSIQAPINGEVVSEIVNIEVATNDNEGISKVEFYINDSLIFIDIDVPYFYSWNTSSYLDGSKHKIHVISYDFTEKAE